MYGVKIDFCFSLMCELLGSVIERELLGPSVKWALLGPVAKREQLGPSVKWALLGSDFILFHA